MAIAMACNGEIVCMNRCVSLSDQLSGLSSMVQHAACGRYYVGGLLNIDCVLGVRVCSVQSEEPLFLGTWPLDLSTTTLLQRAVSDCFYSGSCASRTAIAIPRNQLCYHLSASALQNRDS